MRLAVAHKSGISREQASLFPPSLDDFVGPDHPVRIIDAFVDSLDLAKLGFARVVAEATGRPPYLPSDLLKLYVYGYLNQIRSSRRLEREARRNVEVLWLLRSLSPSFKTIADFRKDHPKGISGVCRAFMQFCRGQSLYGGEVVAIDGSKIQAVASRKKVITPESLENKAVALDRKIAEYLAAMDAADQAESAAEEPTPTEVTAALAALRERRDEVRRQAEMLAAEGLSQMVVGEAEARLMRTANHGHQVAYNVQTAVDAKHGLIVACEVTSDGNDRQQLYPMAELARQELGVKTLTAVADTGYSTGEQGRQCEEAGITPIVPRPDTTNPAGKQFFSRDAFRYDPTSDSWQCPAGKTLALRQVSQTEKQKKYWTKACSQCPLRSDCTKAAKRVIVRHFFEDDCEAMHQRAQSDPHWMKLRRETVEHPFGTIKWMMGVPRFLLRGIQKAKSEMALCVMAYNLKRAINILGVPALLAALKASPM